MNPITIAIRIIRFFQSGYLFSIGSLVASPEAGRGVSARKVRAGRYQGRPETPCSDIFERTFGQRSSNSHFLYLYLNVVGNLKNDKVVCNLSDLSGNAARGNHFITFIKARHKRLVLFSTLGLGAPDQEIENQNKAGKEDYLPHNTHTARLASRLSHCQCGHHRYETDQKQLN